jgi:hypothetical protein
VFDRFEQVSERQKKSIPLFLESMHAVLQRPFEGTNKLVVAMIQRAAAFRAVEVRDPRAVKALEGIRTFIASVAKTLKADNKTSISDAELADILRTLNGTRPEKKPPKRHPQVFGGEMERTWGEWMDSLFQKAFKLEIQKMEEFKQSYDPILASKLAE